MPIVRHAEKHYFETRFFATFADTNVVGNVYFANFVLWQGTCREYFFAEMCPEILDYIKKGLLLITLDLGCRYIDQLYALDHVIMRMNVESLTQNRMMMNFLYYRDGAEGETLVCESHQSIAAMRVVDGKLVGTPFPEQLVALIHDYGLEGGQHRL